MATDKTGANNHHIINVLHATFAILVWCYALTVEYLSLPTKISSRCEHLRGRKRLFWETYFQDQRRSRTGGRQTLAPDRWDPPVSFSVLFGSSMSTWGRMLQKLQPLRSYAIKYILSSMVHWARRIGDKETEKPKLLASICTDPTAALYGRFSWVYDMKRAKCNTYPALWNLMLKKLQMKAFHVFIPQVWWKNKTRNSKWPPEVMEIMWHWQPLDQ
jgi:hypothetical protein